ncbi:MAG TPA: hypothetical protein VIG97_14500 [Luteimonas sp.]
MRELLDTLTNPIFWQGAAAAAVLALILFALVVTLIGRMNDGATLAHACRHGERQAWPARAANSPDIDNRRGKRSELRGGPR